MAVSSVLRAASLVAALCVHRAGLHFPCCRRVRPPRDAIVPVGVWAATGALARPIGHASNNTARGVIPFLLLHRRIGPQREWPPPPGSANSAGQPIRPQD